MIDLYFWTTGNGYKARLMVEEVGLDYKLHPVCITKREQLEAPYRKISPSHKIPTLVDSDGPGGEAVTLIESGAILRYLAAKAGAHLVPVDPARRIEMDQWFYYALSTLTMNLTQLNFFLNRFSEDVPAAKAHYAAEGADQYAVMDAWLKGRDYFAGDYSLADIAFYPYVRSHSSLGLSLDELPDLKRWFETVSERPAVERAWAPI
jgi:GST-like protein